MPADRSTRQAPLVYVSYAWGDDETPEGQEREQIVDDLCAALEEEESIVVGRDKRRVKPGDSIVDFAAEIARSELVLAVISHKSLRSEYCMVHELLQAFRVRNFNTDKFGSSVLALVLADASNDLKKQGDLITKWTELEKEKKAELELADPDKTGSRESWAALDDLSELRRKLPDLLRALDIRAMPRGAEAIQEQNFSAIRELVKQRLDERGLIPSQEEMNVPTPKPKSKIDYYALVFRQNRKRLERPDWNAIDSWLMYDYTWEFMQYDDEEAVYKPIDPHVWEGGLSISINQHIGNAVVAEGSMQIAADYFGMRKTFADLLSSLSQWLKSTPSGDSAGYLLEIFVPTELLLFDWSAVVLAPSQEFEFDEGLSLLKSHPFALRSESRHRALQRDLYILREKYEKLIAGAGLWIDGVDAEDNNYLENVKLVKDKVMLKRISPFTKGAPRVAQLRWHQRIVEAMLPLALWFRHGESPHDDSECHQFLNEDLSCDSLEAFTLDPETRPFCPLYLVPRQRSERLSHQLSHHTVLLLDHPDRSLPSPALDQTHPMSRNQ